MFFKLVFLVYILDNQNQYKKNVAEVGGFVRN